MGDVEVWGPYFGGLYEVSTMGRVRRAVRARGATVGMVLQPRADRDGYMLFGFRSPGGPKVTRRIHRAVAECFLANPLDLPEVNHINGDKSDNGLRNLEWIGGQQNKDHAWRSGLCAGKIVITRERMWIISHLRSNGMSQEEVGRMLGISQGAISCAELGKRKHLWVSQ